MVSPGVFKNATPSRPMTILLSGEVELPSLAKLMPLQSLFQQLERIGLEKVMLSQMVSLKAGPRTRKSRLTEAVPDNFGSSVWI